MAGIYIHVPFCRQKCLYCDFYSVASQLKRKQLVDSLVAEIGYQHNYLGRLPITTIYFGGGTPSTLSADELGRLLTAVNSQFCLDTAAEITLEANPEDLTPRYLAELRQLGINRLSVGIQSFVDNHLIYFGRKHTAGEAIAAIENARKAGFYNISADLIYGFPSLTREQWKSNVETMVSLRVEHISAYQLMVEKGSVFYKQQQNGKFSSVDDGESADNYHVLTDYLGNHGYEHYELSNFCRPGFHSRHNSSYWIGEPYLGLGPSAHSFDGTNRKWNVSSVEKYCKAVSEGGTWWEDEFLSERDRYNELIITRLRTKRGLLNKEVAQLSLDRQAMFLSQASVFEKKGLLRRVTDGWIIPEDAWLISDGIMSDLMEI